jgi:phosphatidylglycerol:prolipoprotein diacylglycerol transferase
MCSELFRIPMEWAGVRLFGFGVLLLVWLVVGIVWLIQVGRLHRWKAETWSILPLLGVVGLAIGVLPQLFPDGLPIRGYGAMVLAGSVLGLWMAAIRARQVGIDPEVVMSLAFWMFIAGIVGARLFYVIEYWDSRFQFDSYWATLKEVLNFPQGGLVVYGALIGATLAFGLFCIRHRLPPLALADLIAPSLVAGLALGRIGCLLNGCCYGGMSPQPWALTFPQDSLPYAEQLHSGLLLGFQVAQQSVQTTQGESSENSKAEQVSNAGKGPLIVTWVAPNSRADEGGLEVGDQIERMGEFRVQNKHQVQIGILSAYQSLEPLEPLEIETSGGKTCRLKLAPLPSRSLPVHPTQLYSAIHAGLLSWFLWSYYPFRWRDGAVFAILITVYPIARFLLEIIRIDESAIFGTGLSISQNISLFLLAGAAALWIYILRSPPELLVFNSKQ